MKNAHGELEAVLFDFGNTLAWEWFFYDVPDNCPQWRDVWKTLIYDPYYTTPDSENPGILAKWLKGEMTAQEVALWMEPQLGISKVEILDQMIWACRNLRIYDPVMEFAREQSRVRKVAMVTLNVDLLEEVVIPHYQMESVFSVVVNSFHEGDLDKTRHCEIALKKLGEPSDPIPNEKALFIDNTPENIQAFEAAGGKGYLFVDVESFVSDLKDPDCILSTLT